MLAAVSEALYKRGLNIENITTDVVRRGKTNESDFIINADCTITSYMDAEELLALSRDLSHLKEELDLQVADIRVQRLQPARRSTVKG
jgi:glycine cleavage system regulatory protein